mgnify:CR=1 FL=1
MPNSRDKVWLKMWKSNSTELREKAVIWRKQNAVTTDKVKNFSLQPSFFLILKDVSK